jgi:hypothetical protein
MSDSPRYAALWPCLLLTACLSLTAGCHSFKLLGDRPDKPEKSEKDQGLAAPSKRSLRVSQYVFLSDFELQRNLPIFRELSDLREQVYRDLQLPAANTVVQVYLFEDRGRYERFMQAKYPDLPRRRAFFVAQPRTVGGIEDLLVYTYWGDRIQQDLRHELTHALLHSVLKDVPLWLDEGLAEYFEVPPDWNGTNYRHLELLRHNSDTPFKPDLSRLEQLNEVQQMTPAEYREAWAWVHFMLRAKPEARAVLLAYLQQLRTNSNPGPLGPRLVAVIPNLDDALNRHLDQLEATLRQPASVQP